MNNPNPFQPQAALLEQKNKKRARVKVAVLSIFAFNILLVCPLLIQGCKDKQSSSTGESAMTATNDTAATQPVDTNNVPAVPAPSSTNTVAAAAPVPSTPVPAVAPVPVPVPVVTTSEYVVVKGDSYSKIAHDHSITVKALEAANPGIDPMKLQIGKKLQLPSPSATPSPSIAAANVAADGADVYTVKSGDSLYKIAHDHSITVKSLRAANELRTDKIKVGQKLKLPSSSAAPAVVPAAIPDSSIPAATTASNVPSVPAPAPGNGH